MPVRNTKPYLVDSILKIISRYWFTWERQSIIGALAGTSLCNTLRGTHILSGLVPRCASVLNSMPHSKLDALHQTLRHRLPSCRRGPRPYMELTDIVTWADVRRLIDRGSTVRRACHERACRTLPRGKQKTEHIDAFRKRFNDTEKRMQKFGTRTSILTTGGLTVLTETQESVDLIDIAGTLATSATISFSGRPGFWVINNRTLGGYTLASGMIGQTGIVVAQDAATIVRCDGADIFVSSPAFAAARR